jgi:hypothetical protein
LPLAASQTRSIGARVAAHHDERTATTLTQHRGAAADPTRNIGASSGSAPR